MRRSITLLFLLSLLYLAQAQYQSAVFDYEMGYFNNGQELPAEDRLIFSGEVGKNIKAVEIQIKKPNSNKILYNGLWQRSENSLSESFQLPINYRLSGKTEYDFSILYYRKLSDNEKYQIEKRLLSQLRFYQEQQIKVSNGKVKLLKSSSKLLDDFNQILEEGLSSYRPADKSLEVTFSSMFESYMDVLERDTLSGNLEKLDDIFKQDVKRLMEHEWWVVESARDVQDYPTENKGGSLALNVGYGGALLSGDPSNFTYGTAPYIGLSLPFSNRAYASAIWRNTSISVGAFTQNMFSLDETVYTGPIFGRPYFIGLGYRVFKFIRINAGVVALEEQISNSGNGNNVEFDFDRIQLQPFVGLSAEIRFSLGNNR